MGVLGVLLGMVRALLLPRDALVAENDTDGSIKRRTLSFTEKDMAAVTISAGRVIEQHHTGRPAAPSPFLHEFVVFFVRLVRFVA